MAPIHQVMNVERARRAAAARAGKNRLRGMGHPATAEMNYTPRELEFFQAMEQFKLRTGRKFPTWSEVLGVIDGLGYIRVDKPPAYGSPEAA